MAPVTSEERIEYLEREINDLKEALSLAQAELEELAFDTYKTKLEEAIVEKFASERQAISQSLKEEINGHLSQKEAEQLKIAAAKAQELENKFGNLQKKLETDIQSNTTKTATELDAKITATLTTFNTEKKIAIEGFTTESSTHMKEFISEKVRNFNKLSADIDELKDDYIRKHNRLIEQAEEILAIASSATLSTSFNEEKKARKFAQNVTLICFSIVIFLMVSVPVLLYKLELIDILNWKTQPELAFFAFLKTATLEWPLIWIARLLSKKMQIQQEIYEEYAHKYACALAYSAMRKDIKDLNPDETDLAENKELITFNDKFANTTFVNPTRVFRKNIKTEIPIDIQEAAQEITASLKK